MSHIKKTETKRGSLIPRKPKKRFSQAKNKNSPVEQVLHLQRTIGNRAVNRLIQSGAIQAKLTIGKPNDIYEKEADRVADRVMSMKDGSSVQRESAEEKEKEGVQAKPLAGQITPLIQRQESPGEEEEVRTQLQRQAEEEKEKEPVQTKLIQRQGNPEEKEETVQTKLQRQAEEEKEETAQAKASPGGTSEVTPNIESNINAMKGGGQPLSESSRAFFEPRFGADFSRVRLHTDSRAADTAQSINAKAFTTGKDIVFNSGQYSPSTSSGQHLLAHELTHVVQQNGDTSRKKNDQLNSKKNTRQKIATFKQKQDVIHKNPGPAPPITSVEVYAVSSTKGGNETISANQIRTRNDHGGTELLVYTREIGYGRNQRATFNTNTLKEKSSTPITRGNEVIGWNRIWDASGNESGRFEYSCTSINSPRNTMSDAIEIQ